MASPAQCFYCFECLSASFTGTEPPQLSLVEDLWVDFEASKELPSGSDDDGELEDETIEAKDSEAGISRAQRSAAAAEGDDLDTEQPVPKARQEQLQLPSIGRLQESSASSSPRSSSSSTPSALSTSSSRSALTSATSTTAPSPRPTSLLSQSKRILGSRYPKSTLDTEYPLFVTWNTLSRSGHKSLRGCIGTFEAQELASGLKSYALTSAFGDTRFSPIPPHLLPSLSCSLTLLSSFETCSHPLDWELGVHGIRISFTHRGRRYGATYLPDVAVDQGWTKEETVESLMRKAGWDGYSSSGGGGVSRRFLRGHASPATNTHDGPPWEDVSDFKTVRYQGLKTSASYAEWQEWRKWVASTAPDDHEAWLGL